MARSKPWEFLIRSYADIMRDHHTDVGLYPTVTKDFDGRYKWAMDYVTNKGDYEMYPGKKMMTSLIYAYLANHYYHVPIKEALDDPTLILVDDKMVLYSSDQSTYDKLIEELGDGIGWILGGWGPWSAFYFWAECTVDGYEVLMEHFINDTLDNFTPENYHGRICSILNGSL